MLIEKYNGKNCTEVLRDTNQKEIEEYIKMVVTIAKKKKRKKNTAWNLQQRAQLKMDKGDRHTIGRSKQETKYSTLLII